MKITAFPGKIEKTRAGAAAVAVFEGEKPGAGLSRVDKAMAGAVGRLIKRGDFTPKPGAVSILYPDGALAAERLLLVGFGKRSDLSAERVRLAAAKAAAAARSAGAHDLAFDLDGLNLDPLDLGQALTEGTLLGLYRFLRYKSENGEAKKQISALALLCDTASQAAGVKRGARTGEVIAASAIMARDMVSAPGADMTPLAIAGIARSMGRKHRLRVQVLDRRRIRNLGMGALLGVAAGSAQPPAFVVVEYRGGGRKPWVALVGKTITFDSGGISLKPGEGMDKMKDDMSGGAAVLGAIANAAALNLPLNVVALLPATENMPGGSAYKPGDILTTLSGKTIEIMNTDAEGRLILADALAYACRYKPAAIVDIATLTGACRIALGQEAAGMLGTNDGLKAQLRAAGEKTGERVWELPLWEGYCDLIKSDIADMKNTGGRDGGVITAACLLSKFVGNYPWVHLDIAATAWTEKDRPYTPKGATGFGCRLLTQFLRDYTASTKQQIPNHK
ncbi:MAG: leucyl aminopeptidase [Nitrospiraceae bacterium]|nr:leucyl aminopeptidase [Nitrospiraceae bacterium]